MPDQPADPIHYDMKIPPEKKKTEPLERSSGDVKSESKQDQNEDQGREEPNSGLPTD